MLYDVRRVLREAQQSITVTKMFEVAGENASAGVELSNPSALLMNDRDVSLVRTIPVPVVPQSMCLSGDRIIVTGWHDGKILHELDESGQIIESFAEPFRTENEIRSMGLGIRSILVGFKHSTTSPLAVVAASTEFGMIRGYNKEGVLLWDATPPGFRPIDISPSPRGSGLIVLIEVELQDLKIQTTQR